MKEITIKPQPKLGLARTARMTLRGVRYRLFRSVVTMVVVTVAIAFLMNIVTESVIKRALAENSRKRVQELRLGITWLTRLTVPPAEDEMISLLAAAKPGDATFQEAMNFGGMEGKDVEELVRESATALRLLRFFENLDYGRRRLLVGRAWGLEIFDGLNRPEPLRKFQTQFREIRGLRFPLSMAEFERFLQAWPAYRDSLQAIRNGWQRAIGQVNAEGDLARSLADERFVEKLRAAGFVMSDETARIVAGQMVRIETKKQLERAINTPELSRTIAARMNILPREVTIPAIWQLLSQEGGAEWLAEQLRPYQIEAPRELLLQMENSYREETRLARAEQNGAETGGFAGLGERMSWLILVSLGVCVVGITNAMFMSVTERYREIATMKCLGALDGTIMLIFVLEAGLLGLAGGIAGALLGSLVAVLRLFVGYGTLVAGAFPAGTIVLAWIVAASLGVILAAIGAILPSYKAARLAPMEAMRIE